MNQASAKEQMFNRFVQQWTIAQPTIPYQIENTIFDEPDPTIGYWARVTAVHNRPVRETIGAPGNRRVRNSGNLYVALFGPLNKGTMPIDLLIVAVRQIFQLSQYGPSGDQIYMEETAGGEGGDEGRWYMSTTATPFRYYERY